jgi:hypothetical protein
MITAIRPHEPPLVVIGDCKNKALHVSLWPPHDLGLDESFTVALNDLFRDFQKSSPLKAPITVIVRYELPLLHFEREKRFPIFAKRQSNGAYYWYRDTP